MNGIYIHVPFCVKKCGYCDFYSVTDLSQCDDYVQALIAEIKLTGQEEPPHNKTADTVYFGGGTPSLLSFNQLESILNAVFAGYTVTKDAEITVEVNPGTVSAQRFKEMKSLGINRLSIGVQSFQDDNLRFLDRIHTARDARNALIWAQDQGFHNVGVDLIYGLPGQRDANLKTDLETAVQFEPAHMSCYMLGIEEGTPLFKHKESGVFTPLSEDRMANLFEYTGDFLEKRGYLHYEISNFSRSWETRSRHNSRYWDFKPYRGFGPSAHSYLPWLDKRSWNVRSLAAYIRNVNNGVSVVDDFEILSPVQLTTEALYLGFRKTRGIDIMDFNQTHKTDFMNVFKNLVNRLSDQGLVSLSENRIRLSKKGLLFADHIASMFVNCLD